jgi:hypothetical protein
LVTSCVETALKHVTVGKREGRTEEILRRGRRRRKQLLDKHQIALFGEITLDVATVLS